MNKYKSLKDYRERKRKQAQVYREKNREKIRAYNTAFMKAYRAKKRLEKFSTDTVNKSLDTK